MNASKKLIKNDKRALPKSDAPNSLNAEKQYFLIKFLINKATKKYEFCVNKPSAPTIFVARHLDMHGPTTILKSANFNLHAFILSDVLSFKKCFDLFYNYTFSKKIHLFKPLAIVPAFLASLIAPPICRLSNPVPVYRNSASSILTIKTAVSYLELGKNLIVFPDVNYSSKKDEISEIYNGFLLVDKLFYKKHGEHVNFVPLIIDEKNRKILELPAVNFSGNQDYDVEKEEISKKLKESIFLKQFKA